MGEIQYTIIGKAELPEILDTFSGECNSEVPFQFTKVLNYRNDKLEQARNQILEKDKKERKKESSLDVADARANAARKESVTSAGNDPKAFERLTKPSSKTTQKYQLVHLPEAKKQNISTTKKMNP